MVEFLIEDPHGREITRARREGRGVVINVATDADQFKLMFQRDMPWNHRTLLLSAVLFADYRLFETSNTGEKLDDVKDCCEVFGACLECGQLIL